MIAKRLVVSLIALLVVSGAAYAGKAKKPAGPTKGFPLIEVTLSSKFERYLKQSEKLDQEIAQLENEPDKDDKKYKDELKELKEEYQELENSVIDRVDRESKSINREIKSLDKKLDSLDKQLEGAGDNEKKYDKIMMGITEGQKKLSALSQMASAYNMFKIACSQSKKGLEATPYGLVGSSAPSITGETFAKKPEKFALEEVNADYKIILFFSMKNRESVAGLRDAISLSGRKTASKETAVIAVNVDTDKDAIADAQEYLGKNASRCTPIHDVNWMICGAYKVKFLPQAVVLDGENSIIGVVIGGGVRKNVQTAIKDHHRNNRKR